MKNKNFIRFLLGFVLLSLILIIFKQHKPETIQSFVSNTHQQFQNFKDNLRDAETKTLIADEKYLTLLGFTENPRLYPDDVWKNTSLPVVVTYVMDGQESQAIGFINNVARVLPNNTVLIYNLGLDSDVLKNLQNYCNNSRCQILTYSLSEYPSHVEDEQVHAYRPIIIQDALHRTGSILFMECNYRFSSKLHTIHDLIYDLYETKVRKTGILAWPLQLEKPVSSLTHKKMFEYFHTDAENFLFLHMISADILFIINTNDVHYNIMLPWIQCALTQDCIVPIGAQSAGCRFDKKPQYRYSGCHHYDISALNIILGLKFKLDGNQYTYNSNSDILKLFETVNLTKANALLKEFEQNITTEGRYSAIDAT